MVERLLSRHRYGVIAELVALQALVPSMRPSSRFPCRTARRVTKRCAAVQSARPVFWEQVKPPSLRDRKVWRPEGVRNDNKNQAPATHLPTATTTLASPPHPQRASCCPGRCRRAARRAGRGNGQDGKRLTLVGQQEVGGPRTPPTSLLPPALEAKVSERPREFVNGSAAPCHTTTGLS